MLLLSDLAIQAFPGKTQTQQATKDSSGRDQEPARKIINARGALFRPDQICHLLRGKLQCIAVRLARELPKFSFSP
jgi:hypothetical protein